MAACMCSSSQCTSMRVAACVAAACTCASVRTWRTRLSGFAISGRPCRALETWTELCTIERPSKLAPEHLLERHTDARGRLSRRHSGSGTAHMHNVHQYTTSCDALHGCTRYTRQSAQTKQQRPVVRGHNAGHAPAAAPRGRGRRRGRTPGLCGAQRQRGTQRSRRAGVPSSAAGSTSTTTTMGDSSNAKHSAEPASFSGAERRRSAQRAQRSEVLRTQQPVPNALLTHAYASARHAHQRCGDPRANRPTAAARAPPSAPAAAAPQPLRNTAGHNGDARQHTHAIHAYLHTYIRGRPFLPTRGNTAGRLATAGKAKRWLHAGVMAAAALAETGCPEALGDAAGGGPGDAGV